MYVVKAAIGNEKTIVHAHFQIYYTVHSDPYSGHCAGILESLLVSVASGNDPGDVDRTLLLLTTHHIESKPLRCLHKQQT